MAEKKRHHRGTAWTEESTESLISIWNEKNVEKQLDDPKVQNSVLYDSIAKILHDNGFEKTPEQCKLKLKNLRRNYRLCKDRLNRSGNSRKTCKYFKQLNEILGSRPASSPTTLIDSGKDKAESSDSMSEASDAEDNNENINDESDQGADIEAEDHYSQDSLNQESNSQDGLNREGNRQNGLNLEDNNNEDPAPNLTIQSHPEEKGTIKKVSTENKVKKRRKSRLEVALNSVMDGFNNASERSDEKYMELEKEKLEVEKKRIELERAKLDYEERQKREERQHQANMLQMIMTIAGKSNETASTGPSFAAYQSQPIYPSQNYQHPQMYDNTCMQQMPMHQSSQVSAQQSQQMKMQTPSKQPGNDSQSPWGDSSSDDTFFQL